MGPLLSQEDRNLNLRRGPLCFGIEIEGLLSALMLVLALLLTLSLVLSVALALASGGSARPCPGAGAGACERAGLSSDAGAGA